MKPTDAPWAGRRCIVVGSDATALATVQALVDAGAEVHWVAPAEPTERVRGIASLTVLGAEEPLSRAVARIGAVVDTVFDLQRAPLPRRLAETSELMPPVMVLGGVIVLLAEDRPDGPFAGGAGGEPHRLHPGLVGPDGVPIHVLVVPADGPGPNGGDTAVSAALVRAGLDAGAQTGVGSRKEMP